MFSWFKRKPAIEKRGAGAGYTTALIGARAQFIAGRSGIAELTATAQSCISLWENGLSIAKVEGTDLLDRRSMALAGRTLALRGDALFLIRENGLVPVAEWDLATRDGKPIAYRVGLPEAGGGRTETVLAGEVLHFRIGCDASAPWLGTAPLRRASLTADMLASIESALGEVFENAPLGSQIVPFPESPQTDLEALGRGFRGRRGRVLLRESVNVSAAGGPAPQTDWRPSDVTPDLSRAMTAESLQAAREGVALAFGVLPGGLGNAAQGPAVREMQRHVAQWTLQPIAEIIAEEVSEKLGANVEIDVMQPLQAFDAGGSARAVATLIGALAQAKEAGIDPGPVLQLVDWQKPAA